MTPEERKEIREPRVPSQPQSRAEHRGTLSKPGGIISSCGCRFTRTGGQWLHVTPCRSHQLADYPLADETMKGALAA